MLLVSTLVSRLLLILVEMASFIRLRIITPAVTVLIRSSHWDCSPVDYDLEKPIFFFSSSPWRTFLTTCTPRLVLHGSKGKEESRNMAKHARMLRFGC